MLNAHAIFKLLLDDEPPVAPPAEDDPFDGEDPQTLLSRYANTPPTLRGHPVNLYNRWQALLKGRTRKAIRGERIGKQTWLINRGGPIALLVWHTDVVTVSPENRVVVDLEGFHSLLSMRAVNWTAPGGWELFGKKKRAVKNNLSWSLYWCHSGESIGNYSDKRMFPFTDGDTIEPDGTLRPQAQPDYSKVK